MEKFILAIDQGTTSTRSIIFNHAGEVLGKHQLEHEQIFPQPGWVEHDPLEIWENTKQTMAGALHNAGITSEQLAAIGITNQRETAVLWDKFSGQPYHNAVVWQDTRTAEICAELAEQGGQDRFRAKTGLPLATYFSGPKIKWLLDNVAEVREAAVQGRLLFGTIESWLIWNLTGGAHVTDVTNASRTQLMNLQTLAWDDELTDAMNIPQSILPQICPSSALYGHTLADGPLGRRIAIAGALGDQQAATVGQACFAPGEAKNTYGTGCFMLLNTGTQPVHSQHGLLTTLCYQFGSDAAVYALEGSIAISGALIQWLRDNLKLIESATAVETLARTVPDNGGIYFVPAFSGLYAPYWKDNARGVIAGLTRYVTRAHFARAALEATAYQTREVLDAMLADSKIELKELKVDGGMVFNELLMQFQADTLGVPVIRPKVAETTALGAAYAAGLAVGFWQSTDEMRQNWGMEKRWQPDRASNASTSLYRQWKKAVTRTFDWLE